MRVGVVRADGHRNRKTGVVFPNLVLMKVSAHHKALGDEVVVDPSHEEPLDLAYVSKIFTATEQIEPFSCPTVYGGTGYDLTTELPAEIEDLCPDYDLYPDSDFALGFTSRGCVRRCAFCVVPEKEGRIRAVGDLLSFWRGQKVAKILDNNLTALPDHLETICKQSRELRVKLDATQGFDARLITPEIAQVMRVAMWVDCVHVAFDSVANEAAVVRGIRAMLDAGFSKRHVMAFVLINFDSTEAEDLYRLSILRDLGVVPFVMLYGDPTKRQRKMARWANQRVLWAAFETFDEALAKMR